MWFIIVTESLYRRKMSRFCVSTILFLGVAHPLVMLQNKEPASLSGLDCCGAIQNTEWVLPAGTQQLPNSLLHCPQRLQFDWGPLNTQLRHQAAGNALLHEEHHWTARGSTPRAPACICKRKRWETILTSALLYWCFILYLSFRIYRWHQIILTGTKYFIKINSTEEVGGVICV